MTWGGCFGVLAFRILVGESGACLSPLLVCLFIVYLQGVGFDVRWGVSFPLLGACALGLFVLDLWFRIGPMYSVLEAEVLFCCFCLSRFASLLLLHCMRSFIL